MSEVNSQQPCDVKKPRAPMNRTLELTAEDRLRLPPRLIRDITQPLTDLPIGTIYGDSIGLAPVTTKLMNTISRYDWPKAV